RLYDDELEERGLLCAQVLLTHADIANRGRYLNARRALAELLARGVVPVINENDTVSVEEIKFGDNDALAAMVVDLIEAEPLVLAQGERKRLRKRWMLDLKARGEIRVDEGARSALIDGKKSLLPSGVREVLGSFLSGDPVEIATLDGQAFARGLAVYSADEVRRICGLRSAEIESRRGHRSRDCALHRDRRAVPALAHTTV